VARPLTPSTGVAIAGLGITELGRVYGASAAEFAERAIGLALDDAGLRPHDVDGLLVSSGLKTKVDAGVAARLNMGELSLFAEVNAFGASAGVMVQMAAHALRAGEANVVVCVFADAPLREGTRSADAYRPRAAELGSWSGLSALSGMDSVNRMYALAARRHMGYFGTTAEQLGAIAVAQRTWAQRNPLAQMNAPMTLDDHASSRMIADPLRLLDCCVVSNGAVAVVLTTLDRARDLPRVPVSVLAGAQAHPGRGMRRNDDFGLVTGAATSGPEALRRAGIALEDIDVVELYDCYTFTVLVTLEDYGFCAKGEGGAFVSEPGRLGPGGRLNLNTGGGQLSGYYMWGMTPLSEAVIQLRGDGGARQVADAELALVSGNGGVLDHHSTLVLQGDR
jgi:acetyl-CoA acetyltransferase